MNKLDKLALKYNSDKYGEHFYTKIYEKFMSKKKNENINLFEIGIGGYVQGKDYSDPYKGGESLKMWRDYFKKGTICGLDIYEKKLVLGSRVNIYKGSQTDPKVLNKIIKEQKNLIILLMMAHILIKMLYLPLNICLNLSKKAVITLLKIL